MPKHATKTVNSTLRKKVYYGQNRGKLPLKKEKKFNRTLNIYHSYGKKKRVFLSVTRIFVAIEVFE